MLQFSRATPMQSARIQPRVEGKGLRTDVSCGSVLVQSHKVSNEEVCSEQTLKRLVELLRSQQPCMAQAAACVIARTCTEPAQQAAACAAGAVPALVVSRALLSMCGCLAACRVGLRCLMRNEVARGQGLCASLAGTA